MGSAPGSHCEETSVQVKKQRFWRRGLLTRNDLVQVSVLVYHMA